MWGRGRSASLALGLALLFWGPVSASEPAYQMTAAQMTELQAVFQSLRNQQEEQQRLLTEQASQLTELKKALNASKAQQSSLEYQLKKARTSIGSSQAEAATWQLSLTEARESFEKSEKAHQQTEKRVKRQRTIWAVLAIGFGAWAAAK